MNALEVGTRLVELFSQCRNHEAVDTLFAPDVVSIQAGAMPGMATEVCGLDALRTVVKWWSDNHTVHSVSVRGPLQYDHRFIVRFWYDVTNKHCNRRFQTGWASLFTVENGKIHEEYFCATG